jgi:DNA mismatch repair protein MutS2
MTAGALRALEFDRIVSVVTGLAVTPTGAARLATLQPMVEAARVTAAQRATSEGTRFLADHPGFPLRAPSDLLAILGALGITGRSLEPHRLLGLSDYLESIEQSRAAVRNCGGAYPILRQHVDQVASFAVEIQDVRRKVESSGEVADRATPALFGLRERLRTQKQKLRTTLEGFVRGRDTAKYLQEHVVTDRNGRHVLVVRAEHRMSIPGIVHGGSASGASLFVEPLETVDINNDIVALEEQEAEEVRRIVLALTDAFRARPDDLRQTTEVATALDAIQARARFSILTTSCEPTIAADGTFELLEARHPLLVLRGREPHPGAVVPVDIRLILPTRGLIIAGPNTGGKTVALKTAGLLAVMAQAGLHIPAERGSRLPVFRSVFADIGDEQSISASLSTFSGHIANIVSMDRDLALPALVLLDEIGAGTDPVEGGALGIAVIDHFRQRGAHLVATTHYDALKSYAATTVGIECAAFGFDAETFAPTYRLIYGSSGRSLAIEIAARLGLPPSVIDTARANLGDREKQLAEHLARIDDDARQLALEHRALAEERAAHAETVRRLESREAAVREREETYRRRLDNKLDAELRHGRHEIDAIVTALRVRVDDMTAQATRRATAAVSTGEAGTARAEARAALDAAVGRLRAKAGAGPSREPVVPATSSATPEPGMRVVVGALGLEGTVIEIYGKDAEVDIRGKRLRAALHDLQVLEAVRPAPHVHVNVDLQPRVGSSTELNVIGCTVDEAITRVEKFLDASALSDQQEIRIVHGHGTGKLRRGLADFLAGHPLVARFEPAPDNQGGSGATIVELKD